MAKITIDVPDAVVQAVLESFEVVYGLQAGMTRAQSTREYIRQYLKEVHRMARIKQAEQTAKSQFDQLRAEASSAAENESAAITVT